MQHGPIFELKTTGPDGRCLWAYRYLHVFEEFADDPARVSAEERIRRAREAVRERRGLGG